MQRVNFGKIAPIIIPEIAEIHATEKIVRMEDELINPSTIPKSRKNENPNPAEFNRSVREEGAAHHFIKRWRREYKKS